jgi:FtsP/CotA-like multicopper oxidase with cupredoxin domain
MASSRRAFIAAALASLGGGAYWWIQTRETVGGSRRAILPPPVSSSGRVHERVLEAKATDWAPAGGPAARAWTYNGTVPGPEIRVVEGDRLRVTLRNLLEEPTSIHWHGLPVPFSMDGVPELTQQAVPPGGTFLYEFTAVRPGTYWYHTHFGYQLDRGLYGALVVEPVRESLRYDQEYSLVLDDWLNDPNHPRPDPLAGGMMGGGMGVGGMMGGMMGGMGSGPAESAHAGATRVQPVYDAVIINGRSGDRIPELRARRGDRLRLRFINAGSAMPLAVRVLGHEMRVTHADGQAVEPLSTRVAVLGMGERLDVLVQADHPGVWPITAFGRGGKRVSAVLRYDGARGPVPADAGNDDVSSRDVLRYAQLSGALQEPDGKPDRAYDLELSGDMMDATRWTINDREYPRVPAIQVHEGERIRLRVVNMSMVPHPVHLHGHFYRLLEVNGERLRHPILKDTVTVGHMEDFVADVVADNPGARWLLHCHNLYHHLGGMAMELRYV